MDSVGDRIRERSRALGLPSQRELARRVDMKPDALSRALSGERGFAVSELLALAKELDVSLHWLATGAPDPRQLSVAARHGYDHTAQARMSVDWDASRPALEGIATAYEQVSSSLPVRIGRSLPSDARGVRAALVESSGPEFVRSFAESVERSFPIDIVRASEVDGGFSLRAGTRTVIAVSDTSNWFYQNFSLAHELGHIAMGSMASIDAPVTDVDGAEREANAFAAELLLPRGDLRARDWKATSMREVAQLIWTAGVSTKALASRLEALRIDAGRLAWTLRSESTQRFLRQHLQIDGADADLLLAQRMQQATTRRFPISLLTAHRDGVEEGRLHAATLAWMLDDDIDAIETELRPPSSSVGGDEDELAALLGLGS